MFLIPYPAPPPLSMQPKCMPATSHAARAAAGAIPEDKGHQWADAPVLFALCPQQTSGPPRATAKRGKTERTQVFIPQPYPGVLCSCLGASLELCLSLREKHSTLLLNLKLRSNVYGYSV